MIGTKLKHKYFYDETYHMGFVFLINVEDEKQAIKILKEKYPHSYKCFIEVMKRYDATVENFLKGSAGVNIQHNDRQFIIVRKCPWKRTEAQIVGVVAHECLHALISTFSFRGVGFSTGSDNEHWTYYLEMLVMQALS